MSESDIDMDRCLLGIDDEKACVPEITWTNCAEQMPPDHIDVIVKANGYETIHTGSDLKAWLCIEHVQWTEFSEEKWEALNKCTG